MLLLFWTGGAAIVTGTLAATEAADTAEIAGAVRVSGALAATESGADVAAMAGGVLVAGSLAASESGADTAAIVGAVRIAGALDASESGSDVAALAGAVIVAGALAAVESGADTADIAGTVVAGPVGSAGEAAPLPHLGLLLELLPVTGTLAATESADTAEMVGAVLVSGALAATEASDTAAIVGTTVAATVAVNLHPLNRARSRYAVRLGGEMVFVDSPQALQAAIDDFEQQTQERARRKGEAVAKTAPRTTPKAAARAAPRVSVVEAPEVDREALAAQMATTNARIRAAYENATRAALIARYLEIEMQVQDDEAAIMALEA